MANVRENLERVPPPTLYHYTTQQGLLGIIRDKEIWASHTQYLNDAREFRHALDLVREELSEMAQHPAIKEVKVHLEQMQRALFSGLEGVNVCVCSFSERGDELSQWRAYGGATSGFAVGFSGPFLRSISEEQRCWLVPVIYEEERQRELIRTLLMDVLQENLNVGADGAPKRPLSGGGNLVAYLNRYAPILKHHAFMEEREWRIITPPLMCGLERFDYRLGGSMLIPYFRLPLAKEKGLGIRDIVVGPTPHQEQSKSSVRGLCTKHDIYQIRDIASGDTSITIRCSQIPYRSW